jgi:hypothetical protein
LVVEVEVRDTRNVVAGLAVHCCGIAGQTGLRTTIAVES